MFLFADGFDTYRAPVDALAGYWDSTTASDLVGNMFTLQPGRFANGQAIRNDHPASSYWLSKRSGQNDVLHHINFAVAQSWVPGPASTATVVFFSLMDDNVIQCTLGLRYDGTLVLTTGAYNGGVVATYLNANTASKFWTTFEVEILIHDTTGYMAVRKNNSPVNSYEAPNLNTRGGSTNSYANRVAIGMNSSNAYMYIDDFMWRSDPSLVPWLGDVQCTARRLNRTLAGQFTRSLPASPVTVPYYGTQGGPYSRGTGETIFEPFFVPVDGAKIVGVSVTMMAALTGRIRFAIYDKSNQINWTSSTDIRPNALLGTSDEIINPGMGVATATFSTPVTIPRAGWYVLAENASAARDIACTNAYSNSWYQSIAYASFPPAVANPTGVGPYYKQFQVIYDLTSVPPGNHVVVGQAQTDTWGKVTSAVVSDNDLYGVAPAVSPPANIIAVTSRMMVRKSDLGARALSLQLLSGATYAETPPNWLQPEQWLQLWRTDMTNPDNGLAWTPAAVDALALGPAVRG
jgi:hypothetical protein